MSILSPTTDRKAWLKERQNGIGASEVASVLGLPEAYETPLQVYARKVAFELPNDEPTEAMEWGNKLEPLIAEAYHERTGVPIVETQVFARAGFLFATLDGIDAHGQIVEFKTISERRSNELGEDDSNEVPYPWILQAHQQMVVVNKTFAGDSVVIAALVGGNRFRTFRVEWNERLWEKVEPALRRFWDQVEARTPPPAKFAEDARALTKIFGECHGFEVYGNDVQDLADRWNQLGTEISAANKERDLLKAQLLEQLGNNQVGILPDGRKLKRSIVTTKEHLVKASTSIRLTLAKG